MEQQKLDGLETGKRGRGRPRIYHTPEERRKAAAKRVRRYRGRKQFRLDINLGRSDMAPFGLLIEYLNEELSHIDADTGDAQALRKVSRAELVRTIAQICYERPVRELVKHRLLENRYAATR